MSTDRRHSILLIMGSVRVGRRCPQIAAWVREIAERSGALSLETIDLRDWHLPADNEAGVPSQGAYTQEATRAWSAKVAGAVGVVIVTPQYNWGYPGALKNALDHIYREWGGKPLAIVTYGGHGGGKCGTQLRQVAEALKMRPITAMPAITVAKTLIETDSPQSDAELEPFQAAVAQAMDELGRLIVG